MDVNAITEALRDLLGPDVAYKPASDRGPDRWAWGSNWRIYASGYVSKGARDGDAIPPGTLDKLHAASTIVRRMAGEAV